MPDGGPLAAALGDLSFCIAVERDEWRLSYNYTASACDDPERVWSRYVTVSNDPLELRPALPDRPVVVRPHSPVVLLPGRWGRFHIRVPVWARFVSRAGGETITVAEAPSRELSLTWFGDMPSGELCYAIQSRLLREAPVEQEAAYAHAQIMVQNSSPERLKFERICIHTERMALFESVHGLWANELKVVFRGSDQISQLTFSKGPPASVGRVHEVTGPRVMPDTHLLNRTFSIIREITGI